MPEKIIIELGGIQKTMLLPLWGRAVETQKNDPLLRDKMAVEIIDKIDCDFLAISKDLSFLSQYGWIRRSQLIDLAINQFVKKHPEATIVNIGCGLDTTFERVDNGKILWYDLDMPDSIELRRKFIKESERRLFIASSFLEGDWLNNLSIKDNVLFFAAGVFYYFKEQQIRGFFKKLADLYLGSEIIFDSTSPIGVKMANKMVIKKSGLDENSFLKWGLKSANTLKTWDNRITILDEQSLFKNAKKGHDIKTQFGFLISEIFKIQNIIHLKFDNNK